MRRRPELTPSQTALVATYAQQLPETWRTPFVDAVFTHLGEPPLADRAVEVVTQACFVAANLKMAQSSEVSHDSPQAVQHRRRLRNSARWKENLEGRPGIARVDD
jgi:hypothetical protein